ncbi:SAM-dependent methyltransferase [Nocardia sp. NBC_01503]|uniref:SAM-dependent methyltransferase n=1 Tax=Nocardia sp. NBC_01503 TaxID=2975997 RepID=UPI002E7C3CD0|nr:SAM-dependent methyltransferase [Nocardia sp. NBC_01503]WTL29259.1 SAM-dependent methyltransferase [Nocardia sp. NBC_01503]
MPQEKRVPVGVDPFRPNAARVYNFMLGGKDNYEADQAVALRMLQVAPDTKTMAWFSREFLLRAVKMAAENGIRQFVDLGAGIPISPNVHEVAQAIQPDALVASIDYDPVVHAHSNALLDDAPGVTTILADIRSPEEIIERARTEAGIDWNEPVAIAVVGVLHFIMDEEKPTEIIARFRDAMAPGSYLAFTHTSTHTTEDFMYLSSGDLEKSPAQVRFRSREQISAFLDGFEVIEPGLTHVQNWLEEDLPLTKLAILGAIGRKSESAS